jgi:hypothetical protein
MTVVVVATLLIAVIAAVSVLVSRWLAERRMDTVKRVPELIFPMTAGRAASMPEPMIEPPMLRPRKNPPAVEKVVPVVPVPAADSMVARDDAPAETVRFRRPGDEPVQLLPARLEVVAGEPRHREIRFVRIPGEPVELILGRDGGDTPHHVALTSSTVSRQHARFAFSGGRWAVANLSHTNPVVVNDEELANGDGERVLTDGDRLELGEVVLRFHAQ